MGRIGLQCLICAWKLILADDFNFCPCSLPSMSIEEAGLAEMEMMRTWTEANQKLADEAKSSWVGEAKKDDSDDEESEYKARAWDDWKDEHPRGAGNKKLTPCG